MKFDDAENEALINDLKRELPSTESQAALEIDMITKPKDLQKAMYQKKLNLEESKKGVSTRSKLIAKNKSTNAKAS